MVFPWFSELTGDGVADLGRGCGQVGGGGTRFADALGGVIQAVGDGDWIAVVLQAGTSYAFELRGASSGNGAKASKIQVSM